MKLKSREYWDSICDKAANGCIYKIIKALGKKHNISDSNFCLTDGTGDILGREAQANAFVEQYSNTPVPEGIPYDLSSNEDLWNMPITFDELSLAIKQIKCTSPGEDGIPARVYKALNASNKHKLLRAYNESFLSGDVPVNWRSAVILPIWKIGKPKTSLCSYRPIALTSVGCKVMERIILKRILDWIMPRQVFNERHFGFLPNSDCTKALKLFHTDIKNARDEKEYTIALKLDIHAAYDSIWRDGLIYKMTNIGITGQTALWIAKWVRIRYFKVKWRGVFSRLAFSYLGVPQGSVLSPILFMIFLHDLFEAIDSGVKIIVYADDIILYVSDLSLENAIRRLQDILARVSAWCSHWKLELRPDKCAAINFSRRQDSPPFHLKLHGADIPWSASVKILGVIFSRNLTFHSHIGDIKKCTKRLNLLKAIARPQWGARTPNLITLVNSLIRSVIDYACPIFSNAAKSSLRHLDVLYNSALRFASGLPKWTPILKLYRETNQTPLDFRRTYLTSSFFIRCTISSNFNCPFPSVLPAGFSWTVNNTTVTPSMLISSYWPSGCIGDYCEIVLNRFPFQTKNLPSDAIGRSFGLFVSNLPEDCCIIATDASKNDFKTSIAAVNITDNTSSSHLVYHLNSIFTAEVLAINLALQNYVHRNKDYLILTDSKSALESLQNVHYKSPAAILHLFRTLRMVRGNVNKLTLMWVPGHAGITPNERADSLAKNGPYGINTYSGVSPEDLKRHLQQHLLDTTDSWWNNCKYAIENQHLGPNIYKWTKNRKEDVFTARFRTQTAVTEERLYRFNLSNSPTCSLCSAGDGSEFHYIFHCRTFDAERLLLFQQFNSPAFSPGWSDLWCILNGNPRLFRLFLNLFLGSGRF